MTVAPVAGPWTTKYRGMANDDDVANVQPDVSSADCPAISRVQVAEQRRCDGRAPSGPQVGRFKKSPPVPAARSSPQSTSERCFAVSRNLRDGVGFRRRCPSFRSSDANTDTDDMHTRSPPMTITITAFDRSPDGGRGLARDTRVRWALEEVDQPYEVRLVPFAALKQPAHLALSPFGQIPTYEEGDLALFETGSIVLHVAERHAGLLPPDANARARAITWMFAAVTTSSRRSSSS